MAAFLINHSTEYVVAMCLSFAEYFIEHFLLSSKKPESDGAIVFMTLSCILVMVGHFFRVGALIEANTNFNHVIET